MSLNVLQDMMPSNLRSMLPLLMIALVVVGNIMFAMTAVVPGWRAYEDLTVEIDQREAALAEREADTANLGMAEILQHQINNARTESGGAAAVLLTDAQANEMLNLLFGYAAGSSVEITNLQAQQAAQAAPAGEYDIRVFRLQIEGDFWNLLNFVAHIQEASALSVAIRAVDIEQSAAHAVMTLETWFYTSPLANGEALNGLPQIILPTAVVRIDPAIEAAIADSDSANVVEVTTVTYLAAPLPLNLLYMDGFDAGVTYVWDIDPVWSFVPQASGQALYVQDSAAPVTFRHRTLLDAAVQARFNPENGSVRLSLRESEAGSYTAIIDPHTNEAQLYRKDHLIRSTPLGEAGADGWYTVQLSAVDDIVRLVVNQVEYIAIRDLAQLPPGTASFGLVSAGKLRVDDFMLWTVSREAASS